LPKIYIEHSDLPGGVSLLALQSPRARSRALAQLINQLSHLSPKTREQIIDRIREQAEITTEQLRDDVMLNWDEVRAMAAASNCAFGSHTVSHKRLSTLSDEQIRHEIVESRQMIEHEIGREAPFFAYPYGTRQDFDDRAVQILHDCGFDCAVTTMYTRIGPSSDLFRLGRVLGANAGGIHFSLGTAMRASLVGQSMRVVSHLLSRVL
jgi:hypothetical protein